MSGRSKVFLLTNGQDNILIDTSVARLWTRLERRLEKLGIKTINLLILTHAHFDHVGNAQRIKNKFHSKVVLHSNESINLSHGDNIIPNGTNVLTRLLINHIGKKVFQYFKYESCQPDLLIDSLFDLNELGFNAYLVHTPGHTTGSISLIIDDEIAIVGDTMFGVFRCSVYPPYALNCDLMIKSWGILLRTNCSIFIPSHGTANNRELVQKDYNKRIKNCSV